MRKNLLFVLLLLLSEVSFTQTTTFPSKVKLDQGQTHSTVNKWDEIESYVNGYARVLRDSKFSFVNKSGQLICPIDFDGARNFSHNLVAVMKDSKWGFINESGKQVVPLQYEIVFDFKETVTAVYANRKWLLINSQGEFLKNLDITIFYGFKNGVANIVKDQRNGIMNVKGEITFTSDPVSIPENYRVPYIPSSVNGITECPENIDFEFGSFLNWKCFIGRVDSIGSTNVISVNPSPPTNNRHTLINRVLPSNIDPYGLFPTNPPDGSNFAVKLGNTRIGAQAERIQYPIRVPINDSNFSIKYDYAVVFEDPGHTIWTQPRFTVRLLDSATNTYVDCASFEYISTSNLPGFARSVLDTGVVYKPWSSVFVSLRGHAGKTMFLEFTTADCVRRGHWGYAYLDVEKPCGQSVQIQYDCLYPNITTLDGPPGFQTYNWWDSSFTTLYGTGQHIVLNPGPQVNSIIWLEMIPYNNFGCKDTIPVKITGVFNANFSLSDTTAVCAPHTFTFYNSNIPSTSANWNFGDGNTGTGDTVTHTYTLPGNYIVTLNVILPGGCVGSVQKNISILQPVGSFYFTQTYYCNNQQVRFDAIVSNADSLFWNFGDGIILPTTLTTVYHTYASPGVYIPFLTVQSAFGCQNTLPGPDTVRIEKLQAGFFETQQKICGSTTLNLTDSSYSYFGINDYQWDFGDGTTGNGNTVSHTYTATGTYNIQLIITGISGCIDTIVKPIYIKVNQPPVAAITGINVQCSLAPITFNSVIQSVDTINFIHWTASNGSNFSGSTFTVGFTLPGTYSIQLIVGTVNGCFDTTTHSITVNLTPDVVQPADQSLCNGSATTAINFTGSVSGTTYSWTNSDPSIGLAASGSGDITSFTAINNTSTPVTATITVTPTANNCPGTSKTFTITVNPTPGLAQPNNQVLCKGDATTAINFTGPVSGTSYNWTNDNTQIGLAANGTGNISSFTTTNNTNAPLVATITVSTNANGCSIPSKVFTITVNPTPDVVQPADQSLCNGSATTAINFTGSVSGTTYNWTNSDPSIGLATSGSGDIASFTAINNTSTPVTATITVTPTANNCPGTSKTFTITVNPTPGLAQPNNQVLCKGDATTAINFTGPVSGTSYNWTNNNTLIGLAANGTGNISSFTTTNNTNAPLVATITVSTNANGCSIPSKVFTITVNPTPDVVQPADQTLCNGSATTAINFTGSVSGTTYNWTNSDPSIGLATSGSGDIASFTAINNTSTPVTATVNVTPTANSCPGISKTFTITVNPTPGLAQPNNQVLCKGDATTAINFTGPVSGTSYNWTNNNTLIGLAANGTGNISSFTTTNNTNAPLVATITVSTIANGCSIPSKVFTITVNPTPDVVQPADQTLCNGSATTAINFTGSVSGTTYNWTNSDPSIGLATSGSGDIASFTAINNTSTPVTATVNVTPTANSCPGISKTFTITVNPTPDMAQPVNQVLCKNVPTASIIFTGLVSGTTYNWANNITMIGLAANGTGNIPSFTAINNTTLPVTATITVTANANGCAGTTKVFTITVNPMPAVTQPSDYTYCNGATTSAIVFATSVSGSTFSWTNDNASIGLSSTGIGNIATFNATNNTNVPVTATITVSATANGCPGPPKTFFITVNPTAAINQPANQVLCNGSSTSAINFTGTVSGTIYNWTNSNPSIGLGASGTGDIGAFTAINNTNIPVTATISVLASANSCNGQTKIFTITVNPTAVVLQPVNQDLCNGSTSDAVIFLSNVNGTTFSWTNNNTAIGLAGSGSGDIAAFTATNTTNAPLTATITVLPLAGTCNGPFKIFTITVNPTPNIIRPIDQTLCNGNITSGIVFSGAVNGTVYNWTNNNTTIGLAGYGAGNINAFTAINHSDTISSAMITVTPEINNCPGNSQNFMIIVKPSPIVDQPGNQALCDRSLTLPITFTATLSGSTFTWTNNNPSIGLEVSGNGDIASFIALNNSDTAIIALINVTATSNGCTGPVNSAVITVNPTPSIIASDDKIVCLGNTVQLSATGGAQYSWTPVDRLSCATCANPVSTPIDSIKYIVKGTSAAGCIAYDSVLLSIIKPFKMAIAAGDSLCIGESAGLHAMQAATYLWSPPAGLNNVNIADPTATPQLSTVYTVVGYDSYRCFTDTGRVTVIVGPKPTVEIGADITTQTGIPVTLNPVTQNGPIVSWLWTPATELSCSDCPNPVASVKSNITYTVTVKNNFGCYATDRIDINVFCKSAQVFIPNAFTPDGDGLNDILMLRGSGISVKTFRIFSRWGELVFERTNFNANDPKYGWDGKIRGVPAPPDVFVYTAEVICDNGINYIYKGNITVLK